MTRFPECRIDPLLRTAYSNRSNKADVKAIKGCATYICWGLCQRSWLLVSKKCDTGVYPQSIQNFLYQVQEGELATFIMLFNYKRVNFYIIC
ncbi:unnamed protein product [Schistosoma intercalatum]|nr:unnamed protein product [Schistosoma intercalatum]